MSERNEEINLGSRCGDSNKLLLWALFSRIVSTMPIKRLVMESRKASLIFDSSVDGDPGHPTASIISICIYCHNLLFGGRISVNRQPTLSAAAQWRLLQGVKVYLRALD